MGQIFFPRLFVQINSQAITDNQPQAQWGGVTARMGAQRDKGGTIGEKCSKMFWNENGNKNTVHIKACDAPYFVVLIHP